MSDAEPIPYPNRIRRLRFRSRLSQKELAKLMDRHPSTIARHEMGKAPLDERDILDYSKVFKCNSYELFMKPKVKPASWRGD